MPQDAAAVNKQTRGVEASGVPQQYPGTAMDDAIQLAGSGAWTTPG